MSEPISGPAARPGDAPGPSRPPKSSPTPPAVVAEPVAEPSPASLAAPANGTAAGDGQVARSSRSGRRRRGSRGRGGRKPAETTEASGPPANNGALATLPTAGEPRSPGREAESEDLPPLARPPRSAPKAKAGGVPRPKIGDTRPAPPARSLPEPSDDGAGPDEGAGGRRWRRRGRGRGMPTDSAVGEDLELGTPVELDPKTLERRKGRERKGRPVGRYLMCVQARRSAIQVAVLEGRLLTEHYVSVPADDDTQIHGNLYLGRVQNVLPGMEAAFVDIGTPKNAVLYRGDLLHGADEVDAAAGPARIEQLLQPGQTVLCQVTKNPIGTKGARLTQEVSLAGRFVVLVPRSSTYGISKRLPDDERRRLRRILDEVRPGGHGLIVRTAAEGATPEELRRDVERLLRQWQQVEELANRSTAPALLYREPPLPVRIIREEFNRDYRGVIIDDPELHAEMRDYVAALIPELVDRVELYDDPDLPLFERHRVQEQLHKALDRKVWLPSGGSLIIERTEALTVIDVNTGKNVGRSNLEETVFRNNLEAATEVARQLRLRDIGGIIVIDFIDMEERQNREQVLATFKEALGRDKTRTQVFDISPLGLVEMTRKRVSEGLVESFSATCPTCAGRGIVLDISLLQ
jgi:ribonuclease E